MFPCLHRSITFCKGAIHIAVNEFVKFKQRKGPNLVLSAKADVVDKIVLLEMGADDYLAVPFQPRELMARLRSLIRHATGAGRKQIYVFENVAVDFVAMNVVREARKVRSLQRNSRVWSS